MQGDNTDPIEITLDLTTLAEGQWLSKFYLKVESPIFGSGVGEIMEYSIINKNTPNGIPQEVTYSGSLPASFTAGTVTYLPINYDYISSTIT